MRSGNLLTIASGFLALLASLSGCRGATVLDPSATSELGGAATEWLILVYMSGDNRLERFAIEDLNEMEAADLRGSGVDVVCLLDRSEGFDTGNGDWAETRLYRVVHDPDGIDESICSLQLPLWDDGPEYDLADGTTLTRFIGQALDDYAPAHTALILWGESLGFQAMLVDQSESMPIQELALALSGNTFDVVAFDSSFSASLEAAVEIRPVAKLMIGSCDVVPDRGWRYDDFLSRIARSRRTPQDFCEAAVESYRLAHELRTGATISAIDLSSSGPVNAALNRMSDALYPLVSSVLEQDALRSLLFHEVEDYYVSPGYLNIDLHDLADVVSRSYEPAADAAAELAVAVEKAVVQQWSNDAGNPNGHGLSVHLIPLDANGTAAPSHEKIYLGEGPGENGLEFVRRSEWAPDLTSGEGLLYRLFYEVLP